MNADAENPTYLIGNEDCGVELGCKLCDRGGKPLAFYPGISENPYDDVPTVTTIQELADTAVQHIVREHIR